MSDGFSFLMSCRLRLDVAIHRARRCTNRRCTNAMPLAHRAGALAMPLARILSRNGGLSSGHQAGYRRFSLAVDRHDAQLCPGCVPVTAKRNPHHLDRWCGRQPHSPAAHGGAAVFAGTTAGSPDFSSSPFNGAFLTFAATSGRPRDCEGAASVDTGLGADATREEGIPAPSAAGPGAAAAGVAAGSRPDCTTVFATCLVSAGAIFRRPPRDCVSTCVARTTVSV